MSEFSMFYKKFECMHASILHVLSEGLTRDNAHKHYSSIPMMNLFTFCVETGSIYAFFENSIYRVASGKKIVFFKMETCTMPPTEK